MKIDAYWDLNSVSTIKDVSNAAKAFEEEFIHMFLKEVRKSLKDPLLGDGVASDIYYDMFDMQISKAVVEAGGVGLTDYIQNAVREYEKNSNG